MESTAVGSNAGSSRAVATKTQSMSVSAHCEFLRIIDNNERSGYDSLGNRKPYIVYDLLLDHWNRSNIIAAQWPTPAVPVDVIREGSPGYVRVLSVLVCADMIHHLQHSFVSLDLHDDRLPLVKPSSQWPTQHSRMYEKLFDSIYRFQWPFFPLTFNSHHLTRRRLDPRYVLPITKREALQEGSVADVHKILIDSAYNELVRDDDGKPKRDTFVLKTYHEDYYNLFENEADAFAKLQNTPSHHIVHCYGSFVQSEKHCLILEYCDGGDLFNFFNISAPPRTLKDVLLFWNSFFGVFKGAHRIHQTQQELDTVIYGLHGDIKPDNLLLMNGPSGSPYDFTAKIADFGYSHFRPVFPGQLDKLGLDRHGNQQYSAPEASHINGFLSEGPNRIDFSADIFALGCVTSVAIIWMALGPDGVRQYFDVRKNATKKMALFRGSGYDGCFHNGVERLKEVDEMHQLALESLQPDDKITPRIVQLVESHMLGTVASRLPARTLETQFEHDFEAAEREMVEQPYPTILLSPESPALNIASPPVFSPLPERSFDNLERHLSSQGSDASTATDTLDGVHGRNGEPVCDCESQNQEMIRPKLSPIVTSGPVVHNSDCKQPQSGVSSASPGPNGGGRAPGTGRPSSFEYRQHLTVTQLVEYRDCVKNRRMIDPVISEAVKTMKRWMDSREHLFFIEDSEAMADHRPMVDLALSSLSYAAKQVDKNGIDLTFASEAERVQKHKRTRKLMEALEKQEFDNPPDKMERDLGRYFEKIIIPRLRRSTDEELTILVFTTGQWGDDNSIDAAGVERPVRHLMQWLCHSGSARTRVTLSFVRFGDDPNGMRHLEFLDNCGREKQFSKRSGAIKHAWDIVDTKSINGNMCKLFVGAVSQHNDDS